MIASDGEDESSIGNRVSSNKTRIKTWKNSLPTVFY